MSNVIETACVPMDAATLWQKIGAFGAVGNWHPMLSSVDSEGDNVGSIRTAHGKDGSTQIERLLYFDATTHTYRYKMESTPMPINDYVGEFHVEDNGDGTSTVEWSAQFDVAEIGEADPIKMIAGFLKAGTDSIEKKYDAQR
jgi:mxaD protein